MKCKFVLCFLPFLISFGECAGFAGQREPLFAEACLMGVCHGSVDQLKGLNASWIRYQIRWRKAEKEERGNYEFDANVAQVRELRSNGIHVLCLLTVEHLNPLYEEDKDNKDVIIEAAARFMESAAIAFRGVDGVLFELSNEPECFPMDGYWNKPAIYTKMARRAAQLMKRAHPDCLVATAGTAWMDKPFLTACLQEGILEDGTIDAVSFHGYHRHVLLPESGLKEDIKWLRDLIAKHKPKRKKVIVVDTERGYCIVEKMLERKHKDSWRNIVYTESEQAAYLARHYITEAAAGIEIAIWYLVGPHDQFGLYTYRRKGIGPSGYVFKNLAALLRGNAKLMDPGKGRASLRLSADCPLPRDEAERLVKEKCPVEILRLPEEDGKIVVAAWFQVESFDGRILHHRERIEDHYYEAWRAVSPKDIVAIPVDIVVEGIGRGARKVYAWDLEATDEGERQRVAEAKRVGKGLVIEGALLRPMPCVYVIE